MSESNPTAPSTAAVALTPLNPFAFLKHIDYFLSDPGHGWLKVKRKRIDELGLTKEISAYSYATPTEVYLEEDQDMSIYLNAEGVVTSELTQEFWRRIKQVDAPYEAGCRSLPGYDGQPGVLTAADITFVLAPEPFFNSYAIDLTGKSVIQQMMESYATGKPLCLDLYTSTKTRPSVSVQCGMHRAAINLELGNYKFATKEKYTLFDHERYTAAYFVLSKNQHIGIFEQYAKKLIARLFSRMPVTNLLVQVYNNKHLCDFRANYPDTAGFSVIGKTDEQPIV